MMKSYLVICILVLTSSAILARKMDQCSLAKEMAELGVPRDQLAKEYALEYAVMFIPTSLRIISSGC